MGEFLWILVVMELGFEWERKREKEEEEEKKKMSEREGAGARPPLLFHFFFNHWGARYRYSSRLYRYGSDCLAGPKSTTFSF